MESPLEARANMTFAGFVNKVKWGKMRKPDQWSGVHLRGCASQQLDAQSRAFEQHKDLRLKSSSDYGDFMR